MPEDQDNAEIDRLRSFVARFAARLGVGPDDAKALDVAASMLAVKRLPIMDILAKDGPLTPEDRERMKENAGLWAEFAEQVDLLRDLGVAELLEKHTEHWDGTGHPAGLAGEAIPLGARILSVCYHYNGMVSERPYRRALTTKRALAELTRLSGTVLDPNLVTLFVAGVEDERKSSRLESRRRAAEPQAAGSGAAVDAAGPGGPTGPADVSPKSDAPSEPPEAEDEDEAGDSPGRPRKKPIRKK